MKKNGILRSAFLPLVIILSLSVVSAQQQFSANKGFEWLTGRGSDGNYGSDIVSTALAVMALKASGQTQYADAGMSYIQSQEDASKHCWPKTSCATKDTAFALLVLDSYGEDTGAGETWLKGAMTAALRDNWFLEIVTTNNGTCRVSYTKAGSTTQTQKDVPVNQGRFTSCRGNFPNTFLEMNTCLESGLLNSNPGLTLDVNCNELGPSTIISVVYNNGNKYYLLKEAATARDVITIQNGCFGTSSKSSCNSDSSLFAGWILHKLDSDANVILWLKNNYDSLKVADNALLYLATGGSEYLKQLKSLQRNDGSFNSQVFDTAVAVLALSEGQSTTEKDSAINWLKSKQSNDGSWENNLYKTAIVLYSSFAGASVSLPGGPGPGGVEPFCGDRTCDPDENSDICPEDCPSERSEICDKKGVCDTVFGENSENCPEDCSCGDRICDNTEDETRCPEDCKFTYGGQECGNNVEESPEECDGSDDGACPGECISPGEENECTCEVAEEGKFPWWLLIAIAAFIIIAAAFYLRTRGRKPTKPSSSSKPDFSILTRPPLMPPPQRPSYKPPASSVKSKVEDELEKSINEAKKLFKKL